MKTKNQLYEELNFFRNALKLIQVRQPDLKRTVKFIQSSTRQQNIGKVQGNLVKQMKSDRKFITTCIKLIQETKVELEALYRRNS